MQKLQYLPVLTLVILRLATSAEAETVTGTIYANNNASFYVKGKLVAASLSHHTTPSTSLSRFPQAQTLLSQLRPTTSPTM